MYVRAPVSSNFPVQFFAKNAPRSPISQNRTEFRVIFVLELNFDVHIFDHTSYISELLVVTMVIDWEPWPANHN